jgi:hypothetical protein
VEGSFPLPTQIQEAASMTRAFIALLYLAILLVPAANAQEIDQVPTPGKSTAPAS